MFVNTISISARGYKEYLRVRRTSSRCHATVYSAPLLIMDYVANYSNVRRADISVLSVHGCLLALS